MIGYRSLASREATPIQSAIRLFRCVLHLRVTDRKLTCRWCIAPRGVGSLYIFTIIRRTIPSTNKRRDTLFLWLSLLKSDVWQHFTIKFGDTTGLTVIIWWDLAVIAAREGTRISATHLTSAEKENISPSFDYSPPGETQVRFWERGTFNKSLSDATLPWFIHEMRAAMTAFASVI